MREILTCRMECNGVIKLVDVYVVERYAIPPLKDIILVEMVNNPHVFTHVRSSDVVSNELKIQE